MRTRGSRTFAVVLVVTLLCAQVTFAEDPASAPASAPAVKSVIVIFDFVGEGEIGKQLADSIRLSLARNAGDLFTVIDQLTVQESSQPTGTDADPKEVKAQMEDPFSSTVGVVGNVTKSGIGITVQLRVLDLRPGAAKADWTETFSDSTERAKAVVTKAISEKIAGRALWKPREVGDIPEPRNFGKPENVNGGFEAGPQAWRYIDNVSTFIEKGPANRGNILRMKNDLARDPWLEYRRKLMFNETDSKHPPAIAQDTSYGGLAGMEGADVISDFFKATPGQRYWLTFDYKGPCGAKVFIKGWKRSIHAEDGLSESALKELGMTPQKFADMTDAQRKKLIEQDAKKHPQRYVRECYDWHYNVKGAADWTHFAGWFPVEGGLPKDVEMLHIKILTIWPPGEVLIDNMHVYKDPNQKAPIEEVKARTPNYGKTSDKIPD